MQTVACSWVNIKLVNDNLIDIYIQVIIWPRCASRSYWHWGSHIGQRALARGPIWLSSANVT